MMFLNLKKHNIDFLYINGDDIDDSVIGSWLVDNKIDYMIQNHHIQDVSYNLTYIIIEEMVFDSEEDIMAFILRWSNCD
jgi:hypothetical protein